MRFAPTHDGRGGVGHGLDEFLDEVETSGSMATVSMTGHLNTSWRIAREEIFGPALCVVPWRNEGELVRMASDTHYELAAFIWTHDIGKALWVAHAAEAG